MTNHRGGRIRAPLNAAECREAISREVMFAGRETRIRRLFRLLRSFVDAENAARIDARLAAQNEANRLKREALALKAASYRLRFSSTEFGRKALLRSLELLEGENHQLRLLLAESGAIGDKLPADRESADA
jgi:hypothetical protein